MKTNPIMKTDYPAPDVVRVGDTYYMFSNTMHFMPGGGILRSYDLIHWEIAGYVFEELEDSPAQRLEGEQNNYGHGMWGSSLCWHDGMFYACFGIHEADVTVIYCAEQVEGPWKQICREEGYHHHSSLFFDEDGKVYLISGYGKIWIQEMKTDCSGSNPEGLCRILVEDTEDVYMKYEGSHFYRIQGKYYLLVTHWPKKDPSRKKCICFVSDSLEGEFVGREVLDDDMGYFNQGVGHGCLLEALDGKWYALLSQDRGAVGRIPILAPVTWKEDYPVFGKAGKVPSKVTTTTSRPYYPYEPLYTSDSFVYDTDEEGHCRLRPQWQWNHTPHPQGWHILPEGGLCLQTDKVCTNLTQSVNTLTQHMMWPACTAQVEVDASDLQEGDYAGICALQGCYGMLAITRELNRYYLVEVVRKLEDRSGQWNSDCMPGSVIAKVEIPQPKVKLLASVRFEGKQDSVEFYYENATKWEKIGRKHLLYFRLDHFTGCRFGLFLYATRKTGGKAVFRDFEYEFDESM